jgi:hypothetical protein
VVLLQVLVLQVLVPQAVMLQVRVWTLMALRPTHCRQIHLLSYRLLVSHLQAS